MADIEIIKLRGLSQEGLEALSRRRSWALDTGEMVAIQRYFVKRKRDPTDAEMETLAQTWSEHCKHKTFTGPILYREGKKERRISNLLKETIMKATRELHRRSCLSVFEDNAGIFAFDSKWAVAAKVETHNHPCAVEPYGGAATGVGGVIRDILGAGRGAKPILNTDVFCFAPPDRGWDVPAGVLHPKRTMKSVVAGVRDYGNRMGIPTAGGGLWFDEGYLYNPLVFCGSVGLLPRRFIHKAVRPGDRIVAVGGRTGRDGIHGATFSSGGVESGADPGAVQIAHAINEKKMLDALLKARDGGLYRAVTDCGAGGFSSAIGELGAGWGARVQLEKAALKYEGLKPWEIWLSESQERMILAVPSRNLPKILALFAAEDVEAAALGEFTRTRRLEVLFRGNRVADLEMEFLHDGLPRRERLAVWKIPLGTGAASRRSGSLRERLYGCLKSWNTCSREWIVRQYDHEVQGATVVKPLQGLRQEGPGDACVIWPISVTADCGLRTANSRNRKSATENPQPKIPYRGIAVSHGINPEYGKRDPMAMAEAAVDEALRNLACVGADVSLAVLLDNFCWGDTKDPEQLGTLVRAALGCYRAAKRLGAPFISGKDSLNNAYRDAAGRLHSIPGTLLISAVGIVPDVRRAVTMDLKGPGHRLYLVGRTRKEPVPRLQASARRTIAALSGAIRNGLALSCHDLSEGGLAVSLCEMAFSGGFGAEVDLKSAAVSPGAGSDEMILFSESLTRFLAEISPDREPEFLRAMRGCVVRRIGKTLATPSVRVGGLGGGWILEESLQDLKAAWQKPFPSLMEPPKANVQA